MKFKLISIMAVWDEQNMISLSIESTKDIVFEYVVLIKKGTDKTKEVVEWCKKKWNLNIRIIETDIKLREARKLAVELTKEYADYYLIQDGDEIYYTEEELSQYGYKTINQLMIEDFDHCQTSMVYLFYDLLHTRNSLTMIIPHPFLFKNLKNINWPDKGDLPYLFHLDNKISKTYNSNSYDINMWNDNHKSVILDELRPYKFDCNIKNYGRMFKRYVFTAWHDGKFDCSIEEFCLENHPSCIYYKKNINSNATLDEIIKFYESIDEEKKWCKKYDEELFYKYPKIISNYITSGRLRGIEKIEMLW